jgi:receptor protein-tyrosine kinase
MRANDELDDGIDVRRLLNFLRRHVVLILATGILLASAVFAYSSTRPKQWTASATLLFRDPGFDQRLFGNQFLSRSVDPSRDAATNLGLVSQRGVAEATARALAGDWTEDAVRERVTPRSVSQSDLVNVVATDTDPGVAARVANAYARTFVTLRRKADQRQIEGAQAVVQQQLAAIAPSQRQSEQALSLERRAQELKILASLQTGRAEIAQSADVPEHPSAPRIKRNSALGLLLGLALGMGIAFLREKLDRRVRDPDEVEGIFGRPILGTVPELDSDAGGVQRGGAVTDVFHALRMTLRFFNVGRDIQTLLVTSANPGDGKSTVSRNLATAMADSGTRTLLIEADLRRPTLAKILGLDPSVGLSTVLTGQSSLSDAIQSLPGPGAKTAGGNGASTSLDAIVAGPIPPNPADLFESEELASLLAECQQRYEFVIVDTPPVLAVPDAVPLITARTAVLIVARMGRTERNALRRLHKYLGLLDAQVLGVVANSVQPESGYGYAYGYESVAQPAAKGRLGSDPSRTSRT